MKPCCRIRLVSILVSIILNTSCIIFPLLAIIAKAEEDRIEIKRSDLRKECKDKTGHFWIVNGYHAGQYKDCEWVREENRRYRCRNMVEVRENCRQTCNMCGGTYAPSKNPAPIPTKSKDTAPPSASPTLTCENFSGDFLVPSIKWIIGEVSCQWAGKSKEKRCKYGVIKEKCPLLCDTCWGVDTSGEFTITMSAGTIKRSCEWAAAKKTLERCSVYPEVKQNCPVTCGELGFGKSTITNTKMFG